MEEVVEGGEEGLAGDEGLGWYAGEKVGCFGGG